MLGGRCQEAGGSKKGTPAWAVFLWVLATLVLTAGAAVGAWWYYKNVYTHGQTIRHALYSELSTGDQF